MPSVGSSGNDYEIQNVNLTDAYQTITLPTAVKAFSIQARNDTRLLWRRSATSANEWTFKEGQVYDVDGSKGSQASATVTLGQCKCAGAGATDVLEIWYWFI